ncbi:MULTISPECIES: carbohydrate ABC transporter permease [unclassified Oceanispirochaeta]|uniref:carbohydrate ABC transporter permease n=1 Tax=unclassified Oceanispirochaeta TaxID=2635722 RepID=UPI000E09A724|nr:MULTISPECIES: sugar ABC transporter permease [unclassified Oceanispirochaeta]MBF9016740.1 sugar ABC transporter permease [Oceanispirochaeta sp. M2]NPD72010.1 sugar ABC transporter permease [Oceanispirochaeta sp. M1]RDG32454.1 sugar ABC transporter permease [Oceanispirochaeta sp. M1]
MIRISKRLENDLLALLLLLPSLIFLFLFTIFPILKSIYMSFMDMQLGMKEPLFLGFANYKYLFSDPLFWKIMGNTFFFAFLTVIPSMIIGLSLAMLLNLKSKMTGFLRVSFFSPVVMPMIAVSSIWMFIYMPDAGLLDQLYKSFGLSGQIYLQESNAVLPALSVVYNWKEAGFLMIFFLSGLQSISPQMYEAARIDGANKVRIFFGMTIPLLMPTTIFVATIALTDSFKLVDHIAMMTEGQPNNSSTTLLYYIYQNGFNYFDQGLASTLTVIMLVIMLCAASIQFFAADKRIHYN